MKTDTKLTALQRLILLLKDESGLTVFEYSLITACISLAIIPAVRQLDLNVGYTFDIISATLIH